MTADTQKNSGVREMFLRTVAVVGLLAVLILGAWGIILLASYLPTVFQASDNTPNVVVTQNEEDNTETPDEVPVVVPATPSVPSTPTYTPPPTGQQPAATYMPAPSRAALYGYADLATRINSVMPAGGDRMNVQFEVQNLGTNIAASGWMFNAELPWYPDSYLYSSPSQRALYPGDRIVYTLGFNRYDYDRNDDQYDECDTYSRDNWDEDDWQDWYDDDCAEEYCDNDWDDDYDQDDWDNWDEGDWEDWFEDYCDDDDNRDDREYRYEDERVMITADPYGRTYDQNRGNNSVNTKI